MPRSWQACSIAAWMPPAKSSDARRKLPSASRGVEAVHATRGGRVCGAANG